MSPPVPPPRFVEEGIVGAIAAAGACVLTNPLDVARVRLQLQQGGGRGPLGVIHRMWQTEGASALMRGLGFSLAYNVVLNSTRFSLYTMIVHDERHGLSPVGGGLCAGFAAGLISSPLAKARTLQQRAGNSTAEIGYHVPRSLDALRVRPFHGSLSWALRNGGHTACIFALYGHLKTMISSQWIEAPAPAVHLGASLQASVISCVLMNPFDLVATRMYHQASTLHTLGVSEGEVRLVYASAVDCAAKTVVADGVQGLYRGLGANIVRIVPHTVTTFVILEALRSHVGHLSGNRRSGSVPTGSGAKCQDNTSRMRAHAHCESDAMICESSARMRKGVRTRPGVSTNSL